MFRVKNILPAAAILCGITAYAQVGAVPAGANVSIRTNESIDLGDAPDGRVYTGVVAEDVRDPNGQVVIPRGADAELIVRRVGDDERMVDLDAIRVGGRRYTVQAADQSYSGNKKEGVGANKRTGKYVGGGAAIGAIIGAIAGGGKGAAIGAATGAGAGAIGQTVTRGRSGRIPAESVITFRLEQPLGTGSWSRDRGYNRQGRHYHRQY